MKTGGGRAGNILNIICSYFFPSSKFTILDYDFLLDSSTNFTNFLLFSSKHRNTFYHHYAFYIYFDRQNEKECLKDCLNAFLSLKIETTWIAELLAHLRSIS